MGNRHLETSLSAFKNFINNDFISPGAITENLCEALRDFLKKSLDDSKAEIIRLRNELNSIGNHFNQVVKSCIRFIRLKSYVDG